MNKQELLSVMRKWDACCDATAYVRSHQSNDAATIIDACTDVRWLTWLLGRERRLSRFVRVCAKRAAKHGGYWVERAKERATWYAAADAAADAAAADAAAYAAYAYAAYAYAYASYAAERAAQLKGLRRIGRDWANGLPAEV